jgi:2-polyprenyl-6-methoxyphenol hydroxylase-like FAD-dependent oxidoreductase
MRGQVDALVIGAGPGGAATAILLAKAGWRVVLVEQHAYPRQKVCGECLTPASLALLDELGVGAAVLRHAGPALTQTGWMSQAPTLVANLPASAGRHRYGRALGRDALDSLLVARARALGVEVLQPARVTAVQGSAGDFSGEIEHRAGRQGGSVRVRAAVIIDAHGSWEAAPRGSRQLERKRPRGADLFGFKASVYDAHLPPGLLPVLSFPGGYGGIVVAEEGRLTLAGCIRRDTLQAWRAQRRDLNAGAAVEALLRHSCRGLREALDGAHRIAPWLAVGPLRPGIRSSNREGLFLVGNAAGEMHPLIGEGMTMAMRSAFLLAERLRADSGSAAAGHVAAAGHIAASRRDPRWLRAVASSYQDAWRKIFVAKSRVAATYAHVAMRPPLARPATWLLQSMPGLLTLAARCAGKSRVPTIPPVHALQSETL